ncbi:MAG: hypothetical protein G01um101429_1046 [Parcubacteria group bacterium Gr01-1014_29]|nr:MAG: hypothetical protein G01um101429_1046 [Parcubacteria group bacterium Gr01-1014_29]
MSNTIRTSILAIGLFVLGSTFWFSPNSLKLLNNQDYLFNYEAPANHEAPVNEPRPETDQKEQPQKAPPHEEILGEITKNLKTVREELLIPQEEPSKTRLGQNTLYALASERVVNLFCELEKNEVAIATGVIIHPDGYILTNAHVTDTAKPKPCLIRNGSPARNYAIAERIFIPPQFSSTSTARENLAKDIALWKITKVLNDDQSSAKFSALAIRPAFQVTDKAPYATFSYPAELLGSPIIVSALYLSFSETIVQAHDAYFIESTQGLGSQKGSSGGILLDPYTGEFAGLIFAINDEKTQSIAERTLFSLTPFAINEAVRNATRKDLDAYLAELP